MPVSHRRTTLALASVALVATLGPLVPSPARAGTAAPAGGPPSAMALVRGMSAEGVRLTRRQAEGPDDVVADGLCSHLAEAGCVAAVLTKDASLLLYDKAATAAAFAGCGDDQSTALGRLAVSFGNPPRAGEARQDRYVAAVRQFRANHSRSRNDLDRITQALMRRGLPMRTAHADDGETRPGLAAGIPGAVDMAATKQVDVIVFGTVSAAGDYAGAADDQVYRRGRVVLSFGNPALLGQVRQARYAAALRRTLTAGAPEFAAAGTRMSAAATPSGKAGCGG